MGAAKAALDAFQPRQTAQFAQQFAVGFVRATGLDTKRSSLASGPARLDMPENLIAVPKIIYP